MGKRCDTASSVSQTWKTVALKTMWITLSSISTCNQLFCWRMAAICLSLFREAKRATWIVPEKDRTLLDKVDDVCTPSSNWFLRTAFHLAGCLLRCPRTFTSEHPTQFLTECYEIQRVARTSAENSKISSLEEHLFLAITVKQRLMLNTWIRSSTANFQMPRQTMNFTPLCVKSFCT